MRRQAFTLVVVALSLFAIAAFQASPAAAQATRTWVSGVGDDANPCSRTAPCKTFAGAISKTAAHGEINVLDPGGFGGVTITKSISIVSDDVEAGVLVAGTNAIIINAAATDVVVLRGLDIEGLGTGLSGIRVLSVGTLHVEDCTINNFRGANGTGIDIQPSAGINMKVFVTDTIIRRNGAGTGGGILIKPGTLAGAANVDTVLTNVNIENNLFGLRADGINLTTGLLDTSVKGGSASGKTNAGIVAVAGGVTRNQLQIDGTVISNNSFGPRADNALVRFGRTLVMGNATGLSAVNGGQLISYGTNQSHGNTVEGAVTTTIPQI